MKTFSRGAGNPAWLSVLALSLVIVPVEYCTAADSYWTAGSGNFTNPANWSAGVPDANTNADFNLASSYTVGFTSDQTSSNAYFNPASGTVMLDIGTNTWTLVGGMIVAQNGGTASSVAQSGGSLSVANGGITVGFYGLGSYTLTGGAVNDAGATVGVVGNNNQLTVSGPSSVWNNAGSVFLGYYGVGGQILVTNSGRFNVNSGILYLGYAGASNTLVVADGGIVSSVDTWFSVDPANGGRNNNALVTGSGAVWSNSASILLGLNGPGNSLVVSNGGTLVTAGLGVGFNSPTNRMTIYSGGTVVAGSASVSYGIGAAAGNNSLTVAGGNLFITNATGTAAMLVGFSAAGDLTLQQGGTARIDQLGVGVGTVNNFGGTLVAGSFSVTNGTVNLRDGSTTEVGSAGLINIGNAPGYTGTMNVLSGTNTTVAGTIRLGENAGGTGVLTVSGPGTVLTNTGAIEVGRFGSGSRMIVSNGATVIDGSLTVGTVGGGNLVLVTGSNSTINVASSLAVFLGYFGKNNQIIVTNGGQFNANGTFYLGYAGGPSNTLLVTDGGQAHLTDLNFGVDPGAGGSNNFAIVNGGGSLLQASSILLGHNGSGNELITTNGGEITVGSLVVGNFGSGNQVHVDQGGVLVVTNSLVEGNNASSSNNLVSVRGGSLFVTNSAGSASLYLGGAGSGTLVLNGGAVTVDRLFATNGTKSVLNLSAGTLNTKSTTVSNLSPFVVGDGVQTATLRLLGGTHAFADGLTIADHGTLAGTGTVNAVVPVSDGGTLSPGASAGTLTIHSNLNLSALSRLSFELGPHDGNGNGYIGGGTNDLIVVNGNLTLDGVLDVMALNGWNPTGAFQTNVFALFSYTGSLTDNGLAFGAMPSDVNTMRIDTSTAGLVNLVVVVPEPSLIVLMAMGCIGLAVWRRK